MVFFYGGIYKIGACEVTEYEVETRGDGEFQGVFIVDEGVFLDYEHPRGLKVGGPSYDLPEELISIESSFYKKAKAYKQDEGSDF